MRKYQNVATLMADAERADLTGGRVAAVSNALEAAGGQVVATQWLAAAIACDVVFTGLAVEAAQLALAPVASNAPFDLIVQRRPGRRRDLLVASLDFGLAGCDTLDEIGTLTGLREEMGTITRQALRGEITLAGALHARAAMLAGAPLEAIEVGFERTILRRGARTLIQTMRSHGAWTVLVATGPAAIARRIGEAIGFHKIVANELATGGDMITGQIAGPLRDADGLRDVMLAAATERQVPLGETLAIGSAPWDAALLGAAGMGVAVKPVRPPCQVGAVLRHADLTGVLYLQGYSAEEFAS